MATAEQGGQRGAHEGAHPLPASMPGQAPAPAHPARPRFSESQAAKLCGVSRSTIQRARKRCAIPGVERIGNGWSLPLEGLLAAGFTPESGAGTPLGIPLPASMPGQVPAPAHPARPDGAEKSAPTAAETAEIHRLELEQARSEGRVMRAERDAAQAIADERQRIIALLEAPRNASPAPEPREHAPRSKTPQNYPVAEPSTAPKRSRWARTVERWRT